MASTDTIDQRTPNQTGEPARFVEVRFPAQWSSDAARIKRVLAKSVGCSESELGEYRVVRKNLDARKRPVQAVWRFEVARADGRLSEVRTLDPQLDALPDDAESVYVVGAGPAGLFAALALIRQSRRPIVLERGQPVRQRRRDLVKITRDHTVDPNSNYCFGEGGAGTYSDGKLYTRSHKRGDIRGALEWLVHFGADPAILVDAHPHIGTNKLPQIIESMRKAICAAGGQVHFGHPPAEQPLVHAAGHRQMLHDDEAAAGRVAAEQYLGDANGLRVVHCRETSRLSDEHLLCRCPQLTAVAPARQTCWFRDAIGW